MWIEANSAHSEPHRFKSIQIRSNQMEWHICENIQNKSFEHNSTIIHRHFGISLTMTSCTTVDNNKTYDDDNTKNKDIENSYDDDEDATYYVANVCILRILWIKTVAY